MKLCPGVNPPWTRHDIRFPLAEPPDWLTVFPELDGIGEVLHVPTVLVRHYL